MALISNLIRAPRVNFNSSVRVLSAAGNVPSIQAPRRHLECLSLEGCRLDIAICLESQQQQTSSQSIKNVVSNPIDVAHKSNANTDFSILVIILISR